MKNIPRIVIICLLAISTIPAHGTELSQRAVQSPQGSIGLTPTDTHAAQGTKRKSPEDRELDSESKRRRTQSPERPVTQPTPGAGAGASSLPAASSAPRAIDLQLIDAVKGYKLDQVRDLLAQGANVNFKDKDGYAPLIYASSWPKMEPMAELLISHRPNVNIEDNYKNTPPHTCKSLWILPYCRKTCTGSSKH